MIIDIDLDNIEPEEPEGHSAATNPIPVADALVLSVRDLHRVDMAHIAHLSDMAEGEAAAALGDAVFYDPEAQEWQPSGVYLSGDLGQKLEAARGALDADPSLKRNIEALENALPPKVPRGEIYVSIGSPWLPKHVILDFVHHLLPASGRVALKILHDPMTGSWNIKGKAAVRRWAGSVAIWGTKRMPALSILEHTLNGRDIRIYDEVVCLDNKSGVRNVINQADTMEALDKQRRINEEFQSWVWADKGRAELLEEVFNRRYRTFAMQRFDGSCLEFPGMSKDVELRPYQRDAVMRILLKKNVLLAHDVGAGKTFVCIAAGMELKRIDPAEKILFVVPNNVVGQWAELFSQVYPASDVLVVHPKSFSKSHRQETLAKIRDGNHDAVIMAHSSFDLIPMSTDFTLEEIDARIAELTSALADPTRATRDVKVERNAWKKRRDKLVGGVMANKGICFDHLGVTRLFVDEAHNYKNLSTGSSSNIRGLSQRGSKKCDHMLDAVRFTMRSGGGVVFATGTVLTNSIADCYTFQRYLQPSTLSNLDLAGFDAWAGMFARRRTAWEIDVDTSTYRLSTSISGFGNLDVLSSMLGCLADFHHMEPEEGLPERNTSEVVVDKTWEMTEYLRDISKRADLVRRARVRRTEDNLLKICSDGRKAALDVRLVNAAASPGWNSKVGVCAKNVAHIWRTSAQQRLTQVVFCDTSTPGAGFNVYDELKRCLIVLGVDEREIAFVHDATSERARSRLFAAMRAGDIRVLVGSTPKLGLGVNVQDRLAAAHHLDVPWRPADMTQREGRIMRQGNTNPRVFIFRYVTKGSFDAYSWQLLERKQHAIDELLAGTYAGGWLDSDVGDTALTYGEIKALAVGNPLLRERVEVANELERTRILHRRGTAARSRLVKKVDEAVNALERIEAEVKTCADDAKFAKRTANANLTSVERLARGTTLMMRFNRYAHSTSEMEIGTYRGFTMYVPKEADSARPSLILARKGRWAVDLGEGKARGVLTRLDNALNKGLPKHLGELENQREILYENWEQAERELADAGGNLTAEIDRLQARLVSIDAQLEKAALNKEEEDEH